MDWSSLYDPAFVIGTVTNTDTYDLDLDTIRKLSDKEGDAVRIYWTDGVGYTDYDIIPADDLKLHYWGQTKQNPSGNYCAKIGSTLVFNHTFVSTDKQFGGTIKVPMYGYADLLVNEGDDVPVDIPDWLVTASAAEYVRTDITLQAQYPLLLAEANDIMERMIDDESAQVDLIFRTPVGRGTEW